MAFFPRLTTGDFTPLFRLLDDYDVHRSQAGSGTSSIRAYAPKFDVMEDKDAYNLHGELPGIKQKDIQIEFTDPQTLVISGSHKHEFTSGGDDSSGRIEAVAEPHQPTVEDEEAQPESKTENKPESQAVTRSGGARSVSKGTPRGKLWISERSSGEFHRTFTFPTRVDQDAVKASLKDGILTLIVPKATPPPSKRITIE